MVLQFIGDVKEIVLDTVYGDAIEAATRFTIIKVSHPDFDVTETINFNIQMQNADAVAYYLYIWVQK